MFLRFSSAVLIGLWVGMSNSHAYDLVAGKAKVDALCYKCHGRQGISVSAIHPHLAGQRESYISIQLRAFRSGKRVHTKMTGVAKELTDTDIENVAAYYARQRPAYAMPE